MTSKLRPLFPTATPPASEAGSHVRMRKRSQAERETSALAARYHAGEISLEELVAGVKEIALRRVAPLLTDEAEAEARDMLGELDFDAITDALRELGPTK